MVFVYVCNKWKEQQKRKDYSKRFIGDVIYTVRIKDKYYYGLFLTEYDAWDWVWQRAVYENIVPIDKPKDKDISKILIEKGVPCLVVEINSLIQK